MPTDRPFRFFGVVHLPPLPGAPRPSAGWSSVLERALADADALVRGGLDGLIIENLGDAPFTRGSVEPHVTACLAVIGDRIRQCHGEDEKEGHDAQHQEEYAGGPLDHPLRRADLVD